MQRGAPIVRGDEALAEADPSGGGGRRVPAMAGHVCTRRHLGEAASVCVAHELPQVSGADDAELCDFLDHGLVWFDWYQHQRVQGHAW